MKNMFIFLAAILAFLSAVGSSRAQEGYIESLKFRDADIRMVLPAIMEKATRDGKKINIILAPEVQGLVSVDLEKINWESALNIVLKTSGFAYTRSRDVIIIAPLEKIKELEQQGQDRSETRIIRLKYLDANDVVNAVKEMLSPSGKVTTLSASGETGWEFALSGSSTGSTSSSGTSSAGERGAIALSKGKLKRSSVLIVTDTLRKVEDISRLLDEMDVMPQQIMIKARIMEVNRELLRDLGVEWATGATGVTSGKMEPVPISSANGVNLSQIALHSLAPQVGIFKDFVDDTGFKVVYQKLGGTEFEVILHALENDTRANLLSAPVILTLNNQEADIHVGQKYPIVSSQATTETSGTQVVTGGSLDFYQNIGIVLRVLPQVWGDNQEYINMVVHPIVSAYSDTVAINDSEGNPIVQYPILNVREADAQIMMKDGDTVVMGGLLKDIKAKKESGIPFLKDIPLLGWAFKRQGTVTEKIDLLIFITASIVEPGEVLPQEIINTARVETEIEKGTLNK